MLNRIIPILIRFIYFCMKNRDGKRARTKSGNKNTKSNNNNHIIDKTMSISANVLQYERENLYKSR